MKFKSKGAAFRKWSRTVHRELSFFFAGMILIYAVSGLVMNHRDSINPHYTVTRKEYKVTADLSDKNKVNDKVILALLEPLMLVFMAGIVLVIVIAVMLRIINMNNMI